MGIGVLGVVENMSGYVCECCGKESNLFGKGGGEVMAREFEVNFLGGVPVDGQWGSLVEEGKRPRYGQDIVKDDGDHDDDDDDDDDMVNRDDTVENNVSAGMDVGLLVDKYRSCSLCVTFEGITSQLIGLVESGHAIGS